MDAELDPKVLASLQRDLVGDVMVPSDAGYDDARRSFNAMIDRRPALIVRCADASDVSRTIGFAREQDLPLGVRGGGHSVAGYGLVDGGLTIDLSRMRAVDVDAGSGTAWADGGCTWRDLDGALFEDGLALVGGVYGDTGIGGLTLGGGIGFLMGTQGLTCDNLIGAELVTASGDVVEVSEDGDAELLWALRGGGGNFGVVTRFRFRLSEVAPMFGGSLCVSLKDGSVLERYAAVQSAAPDGFIAMAAPGRLEDGAAAVVLQVAWQGEPAAGDALVRRIVGDAVALEGSLGPKTYLEIQAINELLPFTLRHYWKSAFVPELSPAAIDAVFESTRGCEPGMLAGMLIEPLHGQARRYGPDHAAWAEREARFHVTALGMWEDPADDERQIGWTRGAAAAVAATGTRGTYVNYSSPDETASRARIAYPPAIYERLVTVKRRLDPDNVFRSNVNIVP